jgi:cellulose synthase/poly-beta-1,6-N-acetylglucosamine synthase-like glycosyltransferase
MTKPNASPPCSQRSNAQSYPRDRIDVVIADDRSTDGTADTIRRLAPNARIVRIDEVPPHTSPKKHALHRAIETTDADILLFTDADCRPEPDWVTAMTARLAHADVVLGLSPISDARGVPALIRAYDTARASMLMIAAAGWGIPYMSLGRSWGYRRTLYDKVGGLPPLYPHLGGDDDLLLQRFVRADARILTCTVRGAMAPTDPPRTLRALVRMRLRHLRAGSAYRGSGAVLLALFEAAQFTTVVVAPLFLIFVTRVHPLIVAVALAAKLLYDTRFLAPALPDRLRGRGPSPRLRTVLLEIVHVLFTAALGVAAPFTRSRW